MEPQTLLCSGCNECMWLTHDAKSHAPGGHNGKTIYIPVQLKAHFQVRLDMSGRQTNIVDGTTENPQNTTYQTNGETKGGSAALDTDRQIAM